MTVEVYSPEKIDDLVLKLIDIASILRNISQEAREVRMEEIPINNRKALEWCSNLEAWAERVRFEFDARAKRIKKR